jgi:hypothetical protein
MDADRFDALSRALTTAPSRRKTLGALLGALFASALPGSVLDPLDAAGKRTRKGQRRATRKDRRREAARLESGEVSASDVGVASHCLPPGAKPCRKGSQCCSGRCKRKKRKCLDCATGTTYCAAQEKCVAPGTCTTSCATGMADCNGDGFCETNTTNSNEHCGTCNNSCDTGETCVNSVCTDGGKTCSPDPCPGDKVCNPSTGFCTCPDNTVQCEFRTNLCTTDANTDSTRCGLNCVDCSTIQDGYRCCNGQCGNGCSPGTNGCDLSPCGPNCEQCPAGKTCCNQGPGTISQCVDLVGGFCPPKPTP